MIGIRNDRDQSVRGRGLAEGQAMWRRKTRALAGNILSLGFLKRNGTFSEPGKR